MRSGSLNYEKQNRIDKGKYGDNPYSRGNSRLTSEKQIKKVGVLVEILQNAGVEMGWVTESTDIPWRTSSIVCTQIIRNLTQKISDMDLWKSEIQYVNLCRNKATGKKIKYVSSRPHQCPAGYELIGLLEKRYVLKSDEANRKCDEASIAASSRLSTINREGV